MTLIARVGLAGLALLVAVGGARGGEADEILKAAGVTGGLVVHVGCGEGKLTAALRAGEQYLVHGLDTDAKNVAAAREHVRAKGLCGKVSVARFDGKALPYADDLVNLVVAGGLGDVPISEVLRVLAPRGVAIVDGRKTVKPWPDDIDEWTHYMHDASGNAVAADRRVGPPRHMQWQGGPKWSRHHDHMASMSAMVSASGRMFYIIDEGSPVSPQLPADWKVIARDAFNGAILWKRRISAWHTHIWPLKSGPANLPRRLVAVGDKVYTTLSIAGPAVALDAATGKTVREYANTTGAEEIILVDGVLLVLVNRTPVDYAADLATDPEKGNTRDRRTTHSPHMSKIWAGIRSKRWSHGDRVIRAFDAAGGKALWEREGTVLPLTLASDGKGVYFHDSKAIVALNRQTGKVQWTSEPVPVWQGLHGQGLQSWFAPTLVVHEGKVLFAGGEKTHMSYMGWGSKDIGQDTMTALDAATGKKLWTADHPYSGYNSPEDLFVIDGKVWAGATAKNAASGAYSGHDIATGAKVKNYPPTVKTSWFHHRCYRAKATDRFILCSRNGIEYVDIKTGQWTPHHWVRGGCLYGIMPCNGFTYSPPHPCACFPEAKLFGFTALAAKRSKVEGSRSKVRRLEKGPAYGKTVSDPKSEISGSAWPTYRHDPARTGASAAKVPARIKTGWATKLGGRLTQPVVAGGTLIVADIDRGLVYALDAASGTLRWTHVAGGRVDSAPTLDRGRVLFGSADGYVTCLRAGDGVLAWRFRAAPVDRRIVSFGQVESAWPVSGSVLVQDGVATVVAGRSMFLDGGLRICRLDVETGKLLGEKVLDDRDPATGKNLQVHVRGLNMPVALPDVLSSDGERLFMRSQAMDLTGKRLKLGPGSGHHHLFAPYGFTDDSWFHRTYWLISDGFSGGIGGYGNGKSNPAGRILVKSGTSVFGYGRKPSYYRWSSVIDYQLFALSTSKTAKAPLAKPGGAPPADASGLPGIAFGKSATLDPTRKPLTIAAWVKTSAKDGTILVRGAQAIGFALIVTDGKLRMLLRANKKTHSIASAGPIGTDWVHVAGVLEAGGKMHVYVNGKLGGTVGGVPLLTGDPLIGMKVGCDDTHQLLPAPLVPFSGAMDEVMLFHRALSGEQIGALASKPAKLSAADRKGLVLHLDFKGGKARDQSAGGNHGRISMPKAQTVAGPFGEALVFKPAGAGKTSRPRKAPTDRKRRRGTSGGTKFTWTRDMTIMVRAMAMADGVLFVAGPRDILDEDAAFQKYTVADTQKRLAAQAAALAGKSGGVLQAVDPGTGKALAEYTLASPPVFDGLIVAGKTLYMSTMDGRIIAFDPKAPND